VLEAPDAVVVEEEEEEEAVEEVDAVFWRLANHDIFSPLNLSWVL
jgi:hypothetical protein